MTATRTAGTVVPLVATVGATAGKAPGPQTRAPQAALAGSAGGGLKVMSLGDLLASPTIKPRELLMAPWLRERHLALVYAPSGIGKSFLALSAALAVAGGGSVPGLGTAPAPRRVLYVDGEMDTPDLQERARGLLGKLPGIDPDAARANLSFLARLGQEAGAEFPDLMEKAGQETVLALADEVGADLVVIDNLSTLASVADENEASAFNALVALLVELKARGKSVLVVHHSRKADRGESSYRGSQKLSVVFNTILRLERPKPGAATGSGAAFVLHWEKYRELRDDNTKAPLLMQLGEAGWTAELDEDERIAALVGELRSLRHTSATSAGKAIGVTKTTAHRLKQKAIAQGKLSLGELTKLLDMAKELKAGDLGDEAADGEVEEGADSEWGDEDGDLEGSLSACSPSATAGLGQ